MPKIKISQSQIRKNMETPFFHQNPHVGYELKEHFDRFIQYKNDPSLIDKIQYKEIISKDALTSTFECILDSNDLATEWLLFETENYYKFLFEKEEYCAQNNINTILEKTTITS